MAEHNEYPTNILVVEDDAAQHSLLSEALSKKIPYLRIDFAVEGLKACELAKEKNYDFIILDWRLSGNIHGAALLNRFRQSKKYETTPILVVSGYLEKKDFALMEEFPFTSSVEKPYRSIFVLKRIRDLCREAQWFREKAEVLESAAQSLSERPERFIETVEKALDSCPRPLLVAMAGAKHLRVHGCFQEALDLVSPFFKKNPDSPRIMSEIGKIYLEMGSVEKAMPYLKKAQQLSPENLERLMDLGGAHLKELEIESAKECFLKGKAVDPYNTGVKDGIALAENVDHFFQMTNPSSIPNSFAGLLNAVGIAMVRSGDIEQGLKHYVSALTYVTTTIDKAKLAFNLALGYLKDVQPDEAKLWFEKSLDLAPEYEKARNYLTKIAHSTNLDRSTVPEPSENEELPGESVLYDENSF